MLDSAATTSVVVAIDGSASAVDAALWAVDEALDRDVPLRFVYVIEPARPDVADSQDIARRLATAEVAVRKLRAWSTGWDWISLGRVCESYWGGAPHQRALGPKGRRALFAPEKWVWLSRGRGHSREQWLKGFLHL